MRKKNDERRRRKEAKMKRIVDDSRSKKADSTPKGATYASTTDYSYQSMVPRSSSGRADDVERQGIGSSRGAERPRVSDPVPAPVPLSSSAATGTKANPAYQDLGQYQAYMPGHYEDPLESLAGLSSRDAGGQGRHYHPYGNTSNCSACNKTKPHQSNPYADPKNVSKGENLSPGLTELMGEMQRFESRESKQRPSPSPLPSPEAGPKRNVEVDYVESGSLAPKKEDLAAELSGLLAMYGKGTGSSPKQ
jgi:hypothetical protein